MAVQPPLPEKCWWRDGLASTELDQLRSEWGPNILPHQPPPSDLHFLMAQFKNPLVLVLVVAMVITLALKELTDTLVIGLAVGINTVLGFVQERKAFRTLESLKNVLSPQAWVVRDAQKQHLDAVELVVGDVMLVHPGDKVSADGVILESNDCWINEAVVTGESSPVEKNVYSEFPDRVDSLHQAASFARQQENIPERQHAWMGSVVSSGTATVLVTHTGADTMLGDISAQVTEHGEEATPLERRLSHLARLLTVIVAVMSVVIFVLGWLDGRDLLEMFTTAVALAVAAIPEGLVVSLTAVLALGMYRILKRQVVVRRLMAAETLGSVTTVCLDKTGTLTEGQLRVVETNFSDDRQAQLAAILANDRRDPLDIARWD
ncbi:MAG: hypothetical protein COU69_04565 [Candidatus Pacebacteria bacterium CG10_big_fil_rev_8_21_14_0_10_56_10]|nr:MAG: hypothetical protein COU69_04565 [Candidatus Pacebacteria bacterium CG10_big_fil_rev_8_21_14_0_10_56_10]